MCRIVFTQNVTDNLRNLLVGRKPDGDTTKPSTQAEVTDPGPRAIEDEMRGFKPSGFKSSFKPAAPAPETAMGDTDVVGQSMEMDDEDVDGEALDGDVDGEELEDLDGEALDDVDGAPMDMEEEDMDGEPL